MLKRKILTVFVLVLLAGAGMSSAQVPNLGGAVGNALPETGPLTSGVDRTLSGVDNTVAATLRNARADAIRTLRLQHSDVVDVDPNGAPVVRAEIVAIAPSAEALAAARARGFTVGEATEASVLGLSITVLHAPAGMSTRRALEALRAADPQGAYDYNHIYLGAGVGARAPAPTLQTRGVESGGSHRVGLIDSGIDTSHPAFANASIQQRGFAGPQALADIHGTEVASLMVGSDRTFRGAAPGASLYIADIYCGQPAGGGVSALIGALSWLAQSNVGVINISLVGPPNRALEAAVRAAIARGFIIVAAVGNDGPSAPPLYPAAYPGVIGVTGVDAHDRVLPEALRGAQVDFAAPGSDMIAAAPGGRYLAVRGTSFAAPIVAGLLAQRLSAPNPQAATNAQSALTQSARDLGARGPDRIFGMGFVGEEVRTSNRQMARR